jgi:hypothetical protein
VSLQPFGLPESFPVRALFLSERSLHYCDSAGLLTVADLAEAASAADWSDRARFFRNMGKKSIDEIRSFVSALLNHDLPAIREILPIRVAGSGIDYGAAAVREARNHTPIGLEGIMQRVVHGQTLEAVARQCGVTRERIRQVESLVVERIERLLWAMPEDRAVLWKEWSATGCLASIASDQAAVADRLGACVIERIFAESDEGKALIAERDRLCEGVVRLMELQPAFYVGELKLGDFLGDQKIELTPKLLLFWNVTRLAFSYDQITGHAKALIPKPKRAVEALLFKGEKTAAEVLEFLRKVGVVDGWEIKDLKRNYLYWCEDPDFAKNRILFGPSAALRSRAELIRASVYLRRQAALPEVVATVRPPPKTDFGPGYEALAKLDQKLRGILAASSESQSLFGLLPARQELQNEAINALKVVVEGRIDRLLTCLRNLPCVTGYVLVVGPGSRMESLAFFEPLEDYLGFHIPVARRNELTDGFKLACRDLGLLPIPVRERTDNVGPIVFQAAIIPRFVDILIPKLLRELANGIPPDIDDAAELEAFAARVAHHINPSQARLRKVLQGDAGVAVCRLLIRAYQTGDFAQLPPHLEARCTEAFRDVYLKGRDSLKSPYVQFERGTCELFLVLPRQPVRLVRPDTLWRVESNEQYPVENETRIAISEETAVRMKVELSPLASVKHHKWEHALAIHPSTGDPVWVFDAVTGRRAQLKPGDEDGLETLRLPSGREFFVLALASVVSDIAQESWKDIGSGLKTIFYESFWTQAEMVLTLPEGKRVKIACRQEPCVLVELDHEGGRLQTSVGEDVFFGARVAITLIAAEDGAGAPVQHTLRILSAGGVEAQGSEDALRSFFADHVTSLAPGIHRIDLEFRAHRKVARRTFYYWKGLTHLDYSFGFCCRAAPQNINWAESQGIASDPRGVCVPRRWRSPEVNFALTTPAVILPVRRPGVAVALLDPGTGYEEPLELNGLLHVPNNDPRRIVVRLELSRGWGLWVNQQALKQTDDGSIRVICRLDSLIMDGVNSARVIARSESGLEVPVLRLQRRVAVRSFRIESDTVEDRYYVSFTVPEGVKRLAINRSPLLPWKGANADSSRTEIELVPGYQVLDFTGLPKTCALVKESEQKQVFVELFVPFASLQDDWHVMELSYRDERSSEWAALHVADAVDAYGSRWIYSPPPVQRLSDDFVRSVMQLAQNRSDIRLQKIKAPAISAKDRQVHEVFEIFESLLDYQYSPSGWKSVQWVRDGFYWFAQRIQSSHPAVLGLRAVQGLGARALQFERYHPLLFGCSELACALPGGYFDLQSYPPGVVGECFRQIGHRSRKTSVVEMLQMVPPVIEAQLFACFENFPRVATGMADRFLNLRAEVMLRYLAEGVVDFDLQSSRGESEPVPSMRQWAEAHYSLERRLIRLQAMQRDGAGPLNDIAQFARRQHLLQLAFRHAYHNQSRGSLAWDGLPGSETARSVLQLVFWIAAVGRATANNYLTQEQYLNVLEQVFSDPFGRGLTSVLGSPPSGMRSQCFFGN